MKQTIQNLLTSILREMGVGGVEPEVTISENPAHGDYSTNVALRVAKNLKKSSLDVALQVADKLNKQITSFKANRPTHNISKDNQKSARKNAGNDILQDIDKVEAVAPGFINVYMTQSFLSNQIGKVLNQGEAYGTSRNGKPMRVTVEFTDPNPFKEFHIGHLYSNSVGESLSRLFESQSHVVRRVNYQGDVGMHVAKAIWGLMGQDIADLESLPLPARIHALGTAYAKGAKAFEDEKKAAEEIKRLNKLLFIAAQRMWQREKGLKPIVDYAGGTPIDKKEIDVLAKVYETGRAWSLEYFETIYKRLGTTFQGYYFESMVGEKGVAIVQKHLKDGMFEQSDGAVVYRGEKKGLHTRVFINQLGLPTYEAKELGLAPTKYEDWPYDQSVIITANEINEYFKVLLAALADVSPDLAAKTKHIGHGMVRKADGSKMSSRTGEILTGEGLLEEVKASIYTILDKNKEKYNKKVREEIAETTAIAALKYSLLRVSLPSDVAFDITTSVSFDGDSGPYLLYTYARAKSVLRKAKKVSSIRYQVSSMNGEERAIARLLLYFPDLVSEAANVLTPSTLCTYLFQLAQAFNLFYQKHPILESDSRLAFTAATAQVLKNGLHLLGIPVVERM